MKRAVAALLTAGIASSGAASAASAAKPPTSVRQKLVTVRTAVRCNLKLATQIPANGLTVTPGGESGTRYGRAGCGRPLFSGVEQSSFERDESGDLQGTYQQWFNAGSIFGEYTLTAQGPPTTTASTHASYLGTVTVTNGTGDFKKAAGTGTLACATTDLAHYTCTEKLKLVQQVLTTVTPKPKASKKTS